MPPKPGLLLVPLVVQAELEQLPSILLVRGLLMVEKSSPIAQAHWNLAQMMLDQLQLSVKFQK